MGEEHIIRVGSRKSELALIQTRYVISLLEEEYPHKKFEIVTMNTLGDNILDIPLPKIGEKSLFTKELETALILGNVDFVVHSLKDLPTILPDGMTIGAVLSREDPRDALVLHKKHKNCNLKTLPKGSVIGTSSLRRSAQLLRKYPNLIVESIRGNLNTRLKKLDELDKYSAIILAAAGLNRIGWHNRISAVLDHEEIMYAVGQGALAVECRENDEKTINLLSPLYAVETAIQVLAERSFLKALGGGCSAPVAVTCNLNLEAEEMTKLSLSGGVWSLDGQVEIIDSMTCDLSYKKSNKRCKACPYNDDASNKLSNTNDIDFTVSSKSCSSVTETEDEVPTKKQKFSDEQIDLLREDPHEHCPVEMPIGSEFMGKCPFLESSPTSAKKLLKDLELKLPTECPFIGNKESGPIGQNEITSVTNKPNLFCGLTINKSTSRKVFEEAELLGQKLAESLMEKGASEVLAKARATIHC